MSEYISGIQQIGIGVKNAQDAAQKYAALFGMNTLVFDDVSEACLMKKYTGGNIYKRRAILSLNMQGGGGIELWQFLDRETQFPRLQPKYGDIGIYAAKIKCEQVERAHDLFSKISSLKISLIEKDLKDQSCFWVEDADKNIFNIVQATESFKKNKNIVGGISGAVIGVSDMNTSLQFYREILNIEEVVSDTITVCKDHFDKSEQLCRRVLLKKDGSAKGAFSKLLGNVEIELVQCLERKTTKIFENRFWGDGGFIHLCFDVFNMDGLKKHVQQNGHEFKVDSIDSFGMENASGRFCYLEDPDGTLIELVETHKVPVLKKMGVYFNLKKRGLQKPLPGWMINLLSLSKVK